MPNNDLPEINSTVTQMYIIAENTFSQVEAIVASLQQLETYLFAIDASLATIVSHQAAIETNTNRIP